MVVDLFRTATSYARREYPPFLYSGRRLRGHVPAFCYHEISAEEYEWHLRYLTENRYQTLTGDELCQRVSAPDCRSQQDTRQVALTFDDGLSSVYTVVFPLLRKYGMKAIAYVVPAWVERPGFLTWSQCREMCDAGVVDIQSHSYSHASVVTSLDLVRVWRRSKRTPIPWGVPGFDPSLEDESIACLPVLEGGSLFSGRAAFRMADQFWKKCTERQTDCGGDLKAWYRALVRQHTNTAVKIDDAALQKWMTDDLGCSREAIANAIPGHRVRHFAFPWHSNSAAAWRATEKAGFLSAAIGLTSTDQSAGHYGQLTRVLRVNADFLPCLPGNRRWRFFPVLATKLMRRAQGKNVYGIAS